MSADSPAQRRSAVDQDRTASENGRGRQRGEESGAQKAMADLILRGPGRPRKRVLNPRVGVIDADEPGVHRRDRKAGPGWQRKERLHRKKKTRGEEVIGWIERACFVPEGANVGQPLKLLDWQRDWILTIYDNPHVTRRAILSVGRKNGKGLALDTPIATPRGFVPMGMLQIGDEVFDENGKPCRVTYISPVHIGLCCWRLRFADGSEIVADQDHQWLTCHSYRPWAQSRMTS